MGRIPKRLKSFFSRKKSSDEVADGETHDSVIDEGAQSEERNSLFKRAASGTWRGAKASFGLAGKVVKRSARKTLAVGKSVGRGTVWSVVNLGRGMNTLSQVVNILHAKGRANNAPENETAEERGKTEKQSPMGLLKEHQEFIVLLLKIILWPLIPLAKLYARCPKCAIALVVLASAIISIFVVGKAVVILLNEWLEFCRNLGWCEMPTPNPSSDTGA